MVMLILNFALGYANDTDRTVGPPIFYWYCHPPCVLSSAHLDLPYCRACSEWIPLWGPVVTLLYLSRTHSQRKKAKFNSVRLSNDNPQAFSSMHSPLIGNPGNG